MKTQTRHRRADLLARFVRILETQEMETNPQLRAVMGAIVDSELRLVEWETEHCNCESEGD